MLKCTLTLVTAVNYLYFAAKSKVIPQNKSDKKQRERGREEREGERRERQREREAERERD